ALTARMERRATAEALRRLGAKPASGRVERRAAARPLLIQHADQASGRLAKTVLERLQIKQAAERLLERAAVKWGPAGLLHRSVALFLAAFAVATVWSGNRIPLAAAGAGCVAAAAPLAYVRRKARQRARAFEEQFPDCLEFISRSMRAGHAFSVALEMAHREFSDPLAAEFRRAFEEQNLGQPLDIVLRKLSQRVDSMDVQFFVSAVLLQKRTGGNLAELLDKLAQLIRERFKLRARIRAVSAQGLMSGRILASIPAAVASLMFVVNPQYARFFVDDPAGHTLLAAGIGLQFVGYLIIKKIVTIEV
ncbi:MAG TPA: type II secretion system F family protein, partial [Limnochordia bacterium]